MRLTGKRAFVTGAAIILCGTSVGRTQGTGSVTATVFNIPGASGNTIVSSINASGDMVGWLHDFAGVAHGFRISNGGFTRLDVPGAANTFLYAINDSGQIVGQFYTGTGSSRVSHGFLFSGGIFTTIDPPGTTYAAVTALNNSGQMAGYSYDSNGFVSGFTHRIGSDFTFFFPPGAAPDGDVTPTGINASGQVVGNTDADVTYDGRGFLFTPATRTKPQSTTIINFPGNVLYTNASAINNIGQIVGEYRFRSPNNPNSAFGPGHGFLLSGGTFSSIDEPDGSYTSATAINNRCGAIAGGFQDGARSNHGFLFAGGRFTMIDLPAAYGTVRGSVSAMNDSGQLVGTFFSDAANGYFGFQLKLDPSLVTGDTDGDGLCDDWERDGLTVDVNGTPTFLDLPAMGADPRHKDIFVQLDQSNEGFPLGALDIAINAFANAPVPNPDGVPGIALHVDAGGDSIMDPKTGATWGPLSKANVLSVILGDFDANDRFSWDAFDAAKSADFPKERAPVFHYAIFENVEILNADGSPGASGISRGAYPSGASDFIVAVNSRYTESQKGSTFTHELGHNLGLAHGGDEPLVNYKPNYLSIMNYQFQLAGVPRTDGTVTYDYSHFGPDSDPSNLLPVLDENHLNETTGLGTPTEPVGENVLQYRSSRKCAAGGAPIVITDLSQVDWDCDSPDPDIEMDVPADANGDGKITVLTSYDDWSHLVYTGGQIGQFGATISPTATTNTEESPEELRRYAEFWASQQQPQDQRAPDTAAALSTPPNASGWHNRDVIVALSATDNPGGSGVKQIIYSASGAQVISATSVNRASASFTINTEGITTVRFFAVDNAGNVEAARSLTIKLDETPPTIASLRFPSPDESGWNNSPVTIVFQCSDVLSGLAASSPPPPTVVSAEGAGRSVKGTCTDVADNVASLTVPDINIDTTPPAITVSPNVSMLWPPDGSMTPVQFSGAATDTTSGVDRSSVRFVVTDEYGIVQPSGNVTIAADGTYSFSVPLEASRLGTDKDGRLFTIAVTAKDSAGNQASRSTTVTVPHDKGK